MRMATGERTDAMAETLTEKVNRLRLEQVGRARELMAMTDPICPGKSALPSSVPPHNHLSGHLADVALFPQFGRCEDAE